MPVRTVLAGAALVGVSVTLFGCGGSDDAIETTTEPPPTKGPVQLAWDNHFDAAVKGADGGGDTALDQIMKDYDEDSMIAMFNDKCEGNKVDTKRNGYAEFKGIVKIREFFSNLFDQVKKAENLDKVGPSGAGPVVMGGDGAAANVFFTYRTQNVTGVDEIKYATDSYSWKIKEGVAKFWKQNVVTTEPGKTCETVAAVARDCTANQKICDGWDNHFGAFGLGAGAAGDDLNLTQALDDIMKDYTADSLVQIYDNRLATAGEEAYSTFKGLAPIRGMFDKLFRDIDAAKDDSKAENKIGLAVKLLEVDPKMNDVFLVWESLSHPKATDTFQFNDDGKIIRQNIVVESKDPNSNQMMV